jgi:hypothetical protein
MRLKLSKSLFDKGKSKNGSWSKAQFEVLGVAYPLQSGWYDGLIGREYEIDLLERFLALKDKHIKDGSHLPKDSKWASGYNFEQCYVASDNDSPPAHIIAECPFDLKRIEAESVDADFLRATCGI